MLNPGSASAPRDVHRFPLYARYRPSTSSYTNPRYPRPGGSTGDREASVKRSCSSRNSRLFRSSSVQRGFSLPLNTSSSTLVGCELS
jgi:hypothetical protein